MGYDSIMQSISIQLTGDKTADTCFLLEQMIRYKDHRDGRQILAACQRIIARLQEMEREQNDAAMGKCCICGTMRQVNAEIAEGRPEEALAILESLVEEIEECEHRSDDEAFEYRLFENPFQEALYFHLYDPKKTVLTPMKPYPVIYYRYGNLLFELGYYKEAQAALRKALRWNPVHCTILEEYIETFKMEGDMDTYLELSKGLLRVAYTRSEVARAFRNLGYYFTDKEEYLLGTGYYLLSLHYEQAQAEGLGRELSYIIKVMRDEFREPSWEEMKTLAAEAGTPVEPDRELIGLACAYGRHFFCCENDRERARYYYGIAHELSDDPNIQVMMDILTDPA